MSTTRPKSVGLPLGTRPRRPIRVIVKSKSPSTPPKAKNNAPVISREQLGMAVKGLHIRRPRWIAWSNDGERIVAKGDSFENARQAAREKGEPDPIVEQVTVRARRA
jgi:hypothetical protein